MSTQTLEFHSFKEFYPFYLNEHRRPWTRVFHFFGTLGLLYFIPLCFQRGSFLPLLWGAMFAYGLAWFSHFFIEKNRPATFKWPLYSLIGDFRMFWELLTFRLPFRSEG